MAHVGKSLSGAASGAAVGSSFGPIGTGIGAGFGFLSGIFSGHGKNNDDAILKQLLSQLRTTGGATARQNQAILGQSLAGGSRLQAQSATARQLNRSTEATFNAEQHAIRQFLGTQIQRDRLKLAQDQQSSATLSQIGSILGTLKQGGAKENTKTGPGPSASGAGGVDIKDVIAIMQLLQGGQGGSLVTPSQTTGAQGLDLRNLIPGSI